MIGSVGAIERGHRLAGTVQAGLSHLTLTHRGLGHAPPGERE